MLMIINKENYIHGSLEEEEILLRFGRPHILALHLPGNKGYYLLLQRCRTITSMD
jgi:hypothetical protein